MHKSIILFFNYNCQLSRYNISEVKSFYQIQPQKTNTFASFNNSWGYKSIYFCRM